MNSKIKVLHITNAYPYDGYESYGIFIKEQIDSLKKKNLDIDFYFINARQNGFIEYFKSIKSIKFLINSIKPDIIHCHHELSLIPFIFIKTKIPFILSVLGDISKRKKLNKIMFYFLKIIPKKIIIKNAVIENSKITYLPNGVNLDLFKEKDKTICKQELGLDIENEYALFVTASLNNPIKRYDRFCEILENIQKIKPNIQPLVMSGVKRELVPLYFNASNLFILTSEHEGSPNAIKEAMACNLPIVSTDVGNVAHLFENNEGLYVIKNYNIDEFTSLCIRALSKGRSNGRNRLKDLGLDIDSVSDKLIELYRLILDL